ncbi:MAG: secretin N-terminal domain-containing protein [Alphaproteobacteria bacterium]|nr:secretin N-terminal domain-containing protein [Alphaproteobacteria bacterium]
MALLTLPPSFREKAAPFFSIVFLAIALIGCQSEDLRNTISEREAVAEQRVEEARMPAAARRYNPLTVTDSVWTGGRAIRMRHGIPLPPRVESNRSVALISPAPMSMRAIATAIATQTGIPVRLGKDVDDSADEDDSSSSAATAANTATAAKKAPVKAAAKPSQVGMRVAYEGPLSGLLDRVSSHFGVNWKYDGSALAVTRYETRTFVMDALPGTQKVKDGMKEQTDNNASASGNTQVTSVSQQAGEQTSSMDIDFKFWDEIGKTLETILGGVGTYSMAPSSGTITVTTTPEVMRGVSDYINQENDRLGRQVAINVEVYTVDMNEGEDFNMKFDTALRRLTNFGGNLTSAGAPTSASTGLGSLAVSVLNPATIGSVTSVFNLLSNVGKTARIAQFPLTTLNNRPVSRRIGRDIAYLASVQTNTSQTFQNTTLTPGIIKDGFSIQVTPRLLGEGRILLQYSLSLIDLVGQPKTFISGGNQIQLPETTTRFFVQQSMLRSGSTLVLAGFDQDQASQSSQGVGNPYNYLLGGGVTSSRVRQILFIAMTPQEITLPRTENE